MFIAGTDILAGREEECGERRRRVRRFERKLKRRKTEER